MVKYIFKDSDQKWKIANSKLGPGIKFFRTQKEAVDYAKNLPNIKVVMLKRQNKWIPVFTTKDAPVGVKTTNSAAQTSAKVISSANNNVANKLETKKAVMDIEQMLEITNEISINKKANEKTPNKKQKLKRFKNSKYDLKIIATVVALFLAISLIIILGWALI